MSGVGQRILAVTPVAALLALVTGLGALIAGLVGFVPAASAGRIAASVAAAVFLGVAAAPLVRASYAAAVGSAAEPPGPPEPPERTTTGDDEHDLPRVGTGDLPRDRTGSLPRIPVHDVAPDRTGAHAVATRSTRLAEPRAAGEKRGTRDDGQNSRHRRRAPARAVTEQTTHRTTPPSLLRLAVVTGTVLVLVLVCWVRPGEPGRVLYGLARDAVGLFGYALPLVPLLALVPVPASRRGPIPWSALQQRDRAGLLALAAALASATRDAVLGRAAGIVLAAVTLFHLTRGAPGVEAGAYKLAGGLLGMLAATPLTGAFSAAGAFGLALAVLVSVAVVTAGHLHARAGRYPAIAALAFIVAAPVTAAGLANRVGYDFYLGVRRERVVVFAGLSPNHRHEVFDAAVALADVPAPMHPVLQKGLKVAGKTDGLRIAAALVDPAKAAADGFQDSGLVLRTGECFSFVGGTSNFRYNVPCNGEHTGEVFYVGHLPFGTDPGANVRAAAARGICEKAYGGYLGAPYGSSYLPMEAPLLAGGDWTPRPLVACLFGAVGPWPLKGTRTVAALQQNLDWTPASRPGPGCRSEPGFRIIADQPGLVCVSPGTAVTTVSAAPVAIDAEFGAVGKGAGSGRVGVACLGADAATGYYATVGGDGVLTVVKQSAAGRAQLAAAGKPKASTSPSPQTTATPVAMVCTPNGNAVRIQASAGKGRQIDVTDQAGVAPLSPRLVVESAEAGVVAPVNLFSAVVAG